MSSAAATARRLSIDCVPICPSSIREIADFDTPHLRRRGPAAASRGACRTRRMTVPNSEVIHGPSLPIGAYAAVTYTSAGFALPDSHRTGSRPTPQGRLEAVGSIDSCTINRRSRALHYLFRCLAPASRELSGGGPERHGPGRRVARRRRYGRRPESRSPASSSGRRRLPGRRAASRIGSVAEEALAERERDAPVDPSGSRWPRGRVSRPRPRPERRRRRTTPATATAATIATSTSSSTRRATVIRGSSGSGELRHLRRRCPSATPDSTAPAWKHRRRHRRLDHLERDLRLRLVHRCLPHRDRPNRRPGRRLNVNHHETAHPFTSKAVDNPGTTPRRPVDNPATLGGRPGPERGNRPAERGQAKTPHVAFTQQQTTTTCCVFRVDSRRSAAYSFLVA